MITCPNCNKSLPDEALFCDTCGNKIEKAQETKPEKPKKKKTGLKITLISIISLLVLGGAAFTIWHFFFKEKPTKVPSYVFYMKDGELHYSDFVIEEPLEITDGIEKKRYVPAVSKDGKTVVYADDYQDLGKETSVSLYIRNVASEDKPVKISEKANAYTISEDGNYVLYTADTNVLYLYDCKSEQSEKLCDSLHELKLAPDFSKIYFLSGPGTSTSFYFKGDLYVKQPGKDTKKIMSDVEKINYISEDYNTVYFTDANKVLYKSVNGANAEKIAGVTQVGTIYDTGEMYYIKKGTEIPLSDFVTNDITEETADVTNLREYLESNTIEINSPLCYYDGKSETVISENCLIMKSSSEQRPVVIFTESEINADFSINLSQISTLSFSEAERKIAYFVYNNITYCSAVKGKKADLCENFSDFENYLLSNDGKTLYYWDKKTSASIGDLYKSDIKEDKITSPEIYDTDTTDCLYYEPNMSNDIVYYKDFVFDEQRETTDGYGTLYINGKKICEKVYSYNYVEYGESKDAYLIYTDYDNDSETILRTATTYIYRDGKLEKLGAKVDISSIKISDIGDVYFITDADSSLVGKLKLFTKGEVKKIADDVREYDLLPDGSAAFICDYDKNNYYGTLSVYKDGKVTETDKKVSRLIYYKDTLPGVWYSTRIYFD